MISHQEILWENPQRVFTTCPQRLLFIAFYWNSFLSSWLTMFITAALAAKFSGWLISRIFLNCGSRGGVKFSHREGFSDVPNTVWTIAPAELSALLWLVRTWSGSCSLDSCLWVWEANTQAWTRWCGSRGIDSQIPAADKAASVCRWRLTL